jgi:bacterioferritin (cytochrome b1)
MATFVGTQANFKEALQALIELEYDVLEAYQAAIDRLESIEYKKQLEAFKEDHQRHIEELSAILINHAEKAPTGPSAKQWITKGKVVLANLMGDRAILSAMLDNEDDTNVAYERMVRMDDQWKDAKEYVAQGLADEVRHKNWLKQALSQPKDS